MVLGLRGSLSRVEAGALNALVLGALVAVVLAQPANLDTPVALTPVAYAAVAASAVTVISSGAGVWAQMR